MTRQPVKPADRRRAPALGVGSVLFDLDGTLLDTARDLTAALTAVCEEEQQPPVDPALASKYVSTGAIGLVRLAFPEADADTHERLRQRLVAIYERQLCVHTRPYPGIIELLDKLDAAGIVWGVVTNKMRYLAVPILDELGLLGRCATVVGGDTAARSKPFPDPIEFALRELDAAPRTSVYVGDAEKDIIAGRAAGTHTVAVTWGYIVPGEDPYQWQADYTITEPLQLLDLQSR